MPSPKVRRQPELTRYPPSIKLECLRLYVHGLVSNAAQAANAVHVPIATVQTWMFQDNWNLKREQYINNLEAQVLTVPPPTPPKPESQTSRFLIQVLEDWGALASTEREPAKQLTRAEAIQILALTLNYLDKGTWPEAGTWSKPGRPLSPKPPKPPARPALEDRRPLDDDDNPTLASTYQVDSQNGTQDDGEDLPT